MVLGLMPIFFFSMLQGKHHHYLLQTMAPWAVLGALGAVRFWQLTVNGCKAELRQSWTGTLVGLPGSIWA